MEKIKKVTNGKILQKIKNGDDHFPSNTIFSKCEKCKKTRPKIGPK